MRKLSSLLVAVLLPLAACKVTPAGAAPVPPWLEVQVTPSGAADSTCAGARWTPVADEAGQAESYVVTLSSDRGAADERRQVVTDHQAAVCAASVAPGDTVTFWVGVASVRRGLTSEARTTEWIAIAADVAPSPPDTVIVTPLPDSVIADPTEDVPPVLGMATLATPRATSPHFDFIRRDFSDMCYCDAEKSRGAAAFDGILSGSPEKWVAIDSTIDQWRYILMWSTLDEDTTDTGATDANSLTGKFQHDMRPWFAAHPQYDYESAWLHDTTTGTPADSAHRLRPHIWTSHRFLGNPADPGYLAYTVDRFRRAWQEHPASTGFFIDELDPSNLGQLRKSRAFAGKPDSAWENAVIAQVRMLRDSLSDLTLQMNAAGYSNRDFPVRLGLAVGSMHLETMNHATQDLPPVWALVDSLIRRGVYVDLVNLESWRDFFDSRTGVGKPGRYPAGNYGMPVYRGKVVQLASYYMVVPADPQKVGLMDNAVRYPLTPDSVDLAVYYLDVGHPKAPRSLWLDVRDPVNQRARVYRRDFDNATILIRPVVYWADTLMTDTTAVPVPLPEGGPWSYVRARGEIVPLDSLRLRNSEAVILIRRQ